MAGLSLNLDPVGGAWPVMPATSSTSDEEEAAVDFGALILSQAQPVPLTPAVALPLPEPGLSPFLAVVVPPASAELPPVAVAAPVEQDQDAPLKASDIQAPVVAVDDATAVPPAASPTFAPTPTPTPASMPSPVDAVVHVAGTTLVDAEELADPEAIPVAAAPVVETSSVTAPVVAAPVVPVAAPTVVAAPIATPAVAPEAPARAERPEHTQQTSVQHDVIPPAPAARVPMAHAVTGPTTPELAAAADATPAAVPAVPTVQAPSVVPTPVAAVIAAAQQSFTSDVAKPSAQPRTDVRTPQREYARRDSVRPVAANTPVLGTSKPVQVFVHADAPTDTPVAADLPRVEARQVAVEENASLPAVSDARPAPSSPAPALPSVSTSRVVEAPVTAAPLETLVPTTDDGAPVMPRLVEMMRWQAQEGGGQAQLRLRPELLGPVTVTIVVEHGAVKAVVSAETPAALEYLRAESAGLQEALEERGLTLDEFEVREESPLAERRRDADDAPPRRESEAAPARRREREQDGDAVFNVLM